MAKTRYTDTVVLDNNHYSTWSYPVKSLGYKEIDLLENIRSFEHIIVLGERADHLAARFFGDESYWWVICLVNGINYPFKSGGWTPGRALRIPFDVKDVLDKLMK